MAGSNFFCNDLFQPSAALLEYEIDPAELGLEKARPVGKVCRSCNVIYQLLFVRFKLQEDKIMCTK